MRNKSNAPYAWQATILRQFEIGKAAGENINTMQHS
ncbi:MAG: hypothetical protein ACJAXH_002106 [Colwellia sp.]|jgi:hypothetical protein